MFGQSYSLLDTVIGLIPGSIGETSVIAIALGALLLLIQELSWKDVFRVCRRTFMGLVFNHFGPDTASANLP